jgi:hypothetical protein
MALADTHAHSLTTRTRIHTQTYTMNNDTHKHTNTHTETQTIINDYAGSVLVFGRSGTGKTVCLSDRMRSDRKRANADGSASPLRQLFVCRSPLLKKMVTEMQREEGLSTGLVNVHFLLFRDLLDRLEHAVAELEQVLNANDAQIVSRFHSSRNVQYEQFRELFPLIRNKSESCSRSWCGHKFCHS